MIQTVHEILDPFDVKTPLGEAVAMFLFTGSINSNPSLLVKFYHTGELRVVDMRDCIAYGNPSAGEKLEPSNKLVKEFLTNLDFIKPLKPENVAPQKKSIAKKKR